MMIIENLDNLENPSLSNNDSLAHTPVNPKSASESKVLTDIKIVDKENLPEIINKKD